MVARKIPSRETAMADHVVPHFHNDPGVPVIEIGAKEFVCIGATPPFDHPHVFCDMGGDSEFICSYCSTLYRYNARLHADQALPAECAWRVPAAT
jgi:uncharacterized Zn-finger protein